jgi:L-ectoine synthase
MKVVRLSQIVGTEKQVECPKGGFTSLRYLLESDNLGFALCKTIIPKGDKQFWHYKNHLEACFCVSGVGELENQVTGETFTITPDTMYALDKNDPHYFTAISDEVVLISVFNPPITGREVHQADGSYLGRPF